MTGIEMSKQTTDDILEFIIECIDSLGVYIDNWRYSIPISDIKNIAVELQVSLNIIHKINPSESSFVVCTFNDNKVNIQTRPSQIFVSEYIDKSKDRIKDIGKHLQIIKDKTIEKNNPWPLKHGNPLAGLVEAMETASLRGQEIIRLAESRLGSP